MVFWVRAVTTESATEEEQCRKSFNAFVQAKSMQKYGNVGVHLWGGKASQDWKEPRRRARKALLQTLKCLDSALSLVVGEVNPWSCPLVVLKLLSYNNFSESLQELRTWLKGLWLSETVTGKLGLKRTSGGLQSSLLLLAKLSSNDGCYNWLGLCV